MFRSILTALKPVPEQEAVIEAATRLAADYGWSVDATVVIDPAWICPPESVPIGAGEFKKQRDEALLASARANASHQLTRITAATQALQVPSIAVVIEGSIAESLAIASQKCDLLMCGHTPGGDASERSLLYNILKYSPRPAIVVPRTGFAPQPTVLIPFDGSAQATRALSSFVASGLAKGRKLQIITFDDNSGTAIAASENARIFLQRHGLASDVRVEPLSSDPGSQILSEVARVSAGMIVMGSFGRNFIQEFFFGSATLSVLNQLPVPVFLDH